MVARRQQTRADTRTSSARRGASGHGAKRGHRYPGSAKSERGSELNARTHAMGETARGFGWAIAAQVAWRR
eukprot:scaffold83818_cov35-Tisochrysis_lutea.AAC.3